MKFFDSSLVVTVLRLLIVILAVSIVSKLSGRPEDSFLSPCGPKMKDVGPSAIW